jgi:hypothetical protein
MRRALLILASVWMGTAVAALPCPTCPKQMLYLPTDKVKLLSDSSNPATKATPSQKMNNLLSSAPAYSRNYYPGNSATQNNKEPDPKYGHRMAEVRAEHDRYVCDPRKMGNSQDFGFMEKRR